jgi:hypothetical protein
MWSSLKLVYVGAGAWGFVHIGGAGSVGSGELGAGSWE